MPANRAERAVRVARLGKRLANHYAKLREARGGGRRPFARRETKPRPRRIVAYDLETTRIKEGTPRPLYLTAYGEEFAVSVKVGAPGALLRELEEMFLVPEQNQTRFVAWNGNGYDVFFIGQALLKSDRYILRPYLTRSKNLRGLRVELKPEFLEGVRRKNRKMAKRLSWEFLDGISMVMGGASMKLEKFLALFAPDTGKLGAPDWEREEFDPDNPDHVEYAERDSEGLYHALINVQGLIREHFEAELAPTIGNMAIRILQRNLPPTVQVWEPSYALSMIIRQYAMRGGYCVAMKRYSGPVWKYDLNQAYAAAMRDAPLPQGRVFRVRKGRSRWAVCGLYLISARAPKSNTIPFYYIGEDFKAVFATREITRAWLVSSECAQLEREGWRVEYHDGYAWDDSFRLKAYVDRLETMRVNAPGGPSGPLGTIVKQIGNNSYGKTVEMLDGVEYVLADDCPEGFHTLSDEAEELGQVWFRFTQPRLREYHQPQIGTFITAHVRMVVRRAALSNPGAFLYADTDCVVFSAPVDLPVDPKLYGKWKVEESGTSFYIITKKVYSSHDGAIRKAKGLSVKQLGREDFAKWYAGEAPRQRQLQRQNWVKVMQGEPMFVTREKVGQKA